MVVKFVTACSVASEVLLVQGKAGAPVILLIFLIWVNVRYPLQGALGLGVR